MENFILGFLTGGSLILAIGPQNLFVIEQGLKKNIFCYHDYLCFIRCFVNFFGVFIYHIFNSIPLIIEVILNTVLILFLLNYIREKFKNLNEYYNIKDNKNLESFKKIVIKTLGFTYLNPHVYSDTILILFYLKIFNFTINCILL